GDGLVPPVEETALLLALDRRHALAQRHDLLRQRPDRGKARIALEQIARRHRADMADAQPEEQPPRIRLPLRLDRGEQVVDGLLLSPFPSQQVRAMGRQPEDIRRLRYPAKVEEFLNRLLAQSFDIERPAADEMAKALETLRRADQPAGAAYVHLSLLPHGFRAADGAMIG